MNRTESTRRNHTGNFTTTLIVDGLGGRIYGHGRTKEAAQASAQSTFESLLACRRELNAAAAEAQARQEARS